MARRERSTQTLTSQTTKRFRGLFARLPADVQQTALKAYRLWRSNPRHASLHFKQVHSVRPIFSVRVGIGHRAVGIRNGQLMIWYWIGSHADYDKILQTLNR